MDGQWFPTPAHRQRRAAEVARSELSLAPRLRQTLDLLKTGASEKQVAAKMGLSPETVHGYVTVICRLHHVDSRAALMAAYLEGYSADAGTATGTA